MVVSLMAGRSVGVCSSGQDGDSIMKQLYGNDESDEGEMTVVMGTDV